MFSVKRFAYENEKPYLSMSKLRIFELVISFYILHYDKERIYVSREVKLNNTSTKIDLFCSIEKIKLERFILTLNVFLLTL